MTDPIKNTDLTEDDLELLSDILNDYLDNFDDEEAVMNGFNPRIRYLQAEELYGRMIGADLSGEVSPVHHIDCTCDWCESNRGE